jgi:argininosuccinate lyase
MAHAVAAVEFRPASIELGPELYAAERANALVLEEGVSFREAYRRIAAELERERTGENER